jgi:hypothetical protein
MFLSSKFVLTVRNRLAFTHDDRRVYWHHHDWKKGHDEQ